MDQETKNEQSWKTLSDEERYAIVDRILVTHRGFTEL